MVPGSSELITVVDEALTAIDDDVGTASNVLWLIVVLIAEGHAWAMGQDWLLGKLLSLEKHWESKSSRVLSVNLFNLD